MIKFQRFYIEGDGLKARVNYHLDNRIDGRACVTMYAKNFGDGDNLGRILAGAYSNNTDSQQDYFDKGKAVLFADHPNYAAARSRAEQVEAERQAKSAARRAINDAAIAEARQRAAAFRQRQADALAAAIPAN